jgi:DNA-binding SARP family transcriptional activator/tetratricopeptide (TPR) repeat protein
MRSVSACGRATSDVAKRRNSLTELNADPLRRVTPIRRFHILVLGPMAVSVNENELDAVKLPRRGGALLRLLATVPDHKRLREEVVDIFWPEASPEAGASNLRSTLQILRQWLGGGEPPPILSERGWVGLNPEFGWQIDLEQFDRLTQLAAKRDLTKDELETAAALHRGDPLAEDRYEDWALPVREGIQRQWRDLCLSAASTTRAGGSAEGEIAWLQRQLDSDPLDEETVRQLLTTRGEMGQRTEALRSFRRFEQRLQEELDVDPTPETMQVVEELRAPRAPIVPVASAVTAAGETLHDVVPELQLNPQGPFVGREEDLGRILASLIGADGERLILISGEAGMGKTRLMVEAAIRSRDPQPEAQIVLFGGCYEQEGRLPYGPVHDALLGYIIVQPVAVLLDRFAGLGGDLSRIVPEIRERMPALSDGGELDSTTAHEGERLRLFWTVGRAVEQIAAGRRLLLLLDDLQWADDSTIQMLHFLVRRFESRATEQRIFIIGAFRPEEVRPGSPLALLDREHPDGMAPGRGRIILEPLTEADSRQVITAQLGEPVAAGTADEIATLSHGNPLFAQQIAALLLQEGRLDQSPAGFRLRVASETRTTSDWGSSERLDVPTAVSEVIARRFRDVDQETREALSLAAVLGEEFAYEAIERTWDASERSLLAALDWALGASVLDETRSGYQFRHPLLRQVLYASASETRRMSLHRRAGLALERLYDRDSSTHAAELALHFSRAGSGYAVRASEYLERAGDGAQEAFAWMEALTYYERGIELNDDGDPAAGARLHGKAGDVLMAMARHEDARVHFEAALRSVDPGLPMVELLRKVAVTRERLGQYDLAMKAFEAAERELDRVDEQHPSAVAAVRLSRAELLVRTGQGNEAQSVAEDVIALFGDEPGRELGLAHHLLAAAALQQGDLERARTSHEQSLKIRRQVGDERQVAQTLVQLAQLMALAGSLGPATEGYREAFSLFERIGDPEGMASCWSVLGTTASYRGSYADAEDYLHRCLALREQIGDPGRIADCWNDLGLVAARRGDLTEAEGRLERGLGMQAQHSSQHLAGAWGALGLVAFGKGEYDKAEEWYHKSLDLQQQIGDQYGYALGLVGLGLVHQCRGDLAAAEAVYRESLELQQRLGGLPWTGYAVYGLGEVASERGHLEEALRLTRQARRLAHKLDLHDLEALAALAQARVFLKAGRSRAPETLIKRAMSLSADNNATKTAAEAALAMAELWLVQSDLDSARAAAQDALQISTHSSLAREQGLAHGVLGRIALARGAAEEATGELEEAEQVFTQIGARLELARVWLALSHALDWRSDGAQALDRTNAALAVFEEVGASLDAAEAARTVIANQESSRGAI